MRSKSGRAVECPHTREKSRALFLQTANIQKIVWASVSFQKRRNRLFSTIDVLFGFGRVSSL